jgi:hypothetical protein
VQIASRPYIAKADNRNGYAACTHGDKPEGLRFSVRFIKPANPLDPISFIIEAYVMAISRRRFLEVGALSTTGLVSNGLVYSQGRSETSAVPIKVDTKNLLVVVDPAACRWSVQVKGTPMQMNDIYFLPGDDPSGWRISSAVNKTDDNKFGSFITVTLQGKKPGQLDFQYRISVSKTGNDILVSLGRTNNTGKPVDVGDINYFVSRDTRLGGTEDSWISLGTHSRNRDEYELLPVINMITPKSYEVNQVVQASNTGNSLLIGHVTASKGASRFDVRSGFGGKTDDRMQVCGYCSYKVVMPPAKSFEGEKLLINFNTDALNAMKHQGDLIALAYDVRLKERKPINLDDRDWVSNDYSRFHGWMSGAGGGRRPGAAAGGGYDFGEGGARAFFEENGLTDFDWGLGGTLSGSFALYGSGGSTSGRFPEFDMHDSKWAAYVSGAPPPSSGAAPLFRRRLDFPSECFLPIRTVKYGGERVIDFSNPLTIKLERERVQKWLDDHHNETGRVEMDFADWWDVWPGQYDPFMSGLETYRTEGMIWREAVDKLPRVVIRSNMQPVDHSYGIVDILRVSDDADQGYEDLGSALAGKDFTGLLNESVFGVANRFFYNGRVFWSDGDGFHIYKFAAPDGKEFTYGEGKVDANFHAFAGNTLFLSEALNVKYPEDRIELLKRISPPTMDVSYPVDLFVRKPAQVWAMPIERPFGNWTLVAVFNYTNKAALGGPPRTFTAKLDAANDLHLDPNKEYLVYEFWTKKFLGTFKGTFTSNAVNPYDVDMYSVVEKQNHPVLISTSRHIRQMAFDIKDLAYDRGQRALSGVSRAVAGDPYQLRIYIPDGFSPQRVQLSNGLGATMKTEGNLLTADFVTTTGKDVTWKVFF